MNCLYFFLQISIFNTAGVNDGFVFLQKFVDGIVYNRGENCVG